MHSRPSVRCLFINNCQSPQSTWQFGTVTTRQSLADERWHKLEVHVTRDMSNNVIKCQVDRSSTKIKVKGLTIKPDGVLFIAGLPGSSWQPVLDDNATCFPNVINFSGCIADLEINFVSLDGHAKRVNTTHPQQFGDVLERCTEAKDSIVSISDENAKVLLRSTDDTGCNTSFEFQFRTRESRAFVGKIMNRNLVASFVLEEGIMKFSMQLRDLNKRKGTSFHLTSKGIFLAKNHWHKVTLIAVEKTGFSLLVNDELTSSYKLTNKLLCAAPRDTKESYSIVRFGGSARKYPSFTGCLRDVHVNNVRVNFSLHDSSKGVLVGKCSEIFSKYNKSSFTEESKKLKGSNSLSSTEDSFVFTKSFEGRDIETSTEPPVISNGSSNASGAIYETPSLGPIPFPKRNFLFDKAYPIALALAVGLLIVVIGIVYVFGAGLKCRFHNSRNKTIKEADESNLSAMLQNKSHNGTSCQQQTNFSTNLSVSSNENDRRNDCNLHLPRKERDSCYRDIYRSPREPDQIPMKVWEDRYLNNTNKNLDANLLTMPQFNSRHGHDSLDALSREKVSANHGNLVGSTIIPLPDKNVMLQKHSFAKGLHDSLIECPDGSEGRRIPTAVNSQSPKHVNKVYSGHDSLPKPKKTPSLSWAYGTRFVRRGHESSDTDCSDIDRVTRVRERNPHVIKSGKVISIRPRHLNVLGSSDDERECNTTWNGNRYGGSRRLHTFTEQTYKLHSLKEEERDVDLEQRIAFTSNKLKVYCKDTYNVRCWNRSSFTEARVQQSHEDIDGISSQVRCLDGYTSSCPESINCLSEKEDKRLSIRRSRRLNTYYF